MEPAGQADAPMDSDTVIILNTRAKGEKARRYIDEIQDLAPGAELMVTRQPDDALNFSREAARTGRPTVVAAGGDGTVNQVVNGIAGTGARLGILPVGTMNVFANELGLPGGLRECWEVIRAGHTRQVDLPKAGGRHFAQTAGIGLDAQIVQETDLDFRKTFGPLSYLMTATQIASRTPPTIRVRSHCGRDTAGSFVVLGNGRYYGGPFVLFSEARLDDGRLDVLIFKNLGYLDIVRYLQGVMTGSHTTMRDVEYFKSEGIEVTSEDDVPVEVDGEIAGSLPMRFSLTPGGLPVLVPGNGDADR